MAMNKRKKTTAVVAGVTAAVLLLGGTFAWTSISQQAKNESAGIVNVGGRLHDDFNGTNKDVYVENFTDPLNGGQPIYARVKLTEYMEVGQDAGGFGEDTNNDGKVTAVPVVNGTDINDKDNWPVHIPAEYCQTCNTGDTCLIHDHWKWEMGNEEAKVFMPTFNKDKDSLDADINGTYHGTDNTDKVYYDDYVVYTTDENGGAVTEADKEAHDGEIYSVTGTEYYDDDTDAKQNDHATGAGVRTEENVIHTAKESATATVITMAEWLQNPVAGNFWVYDEDGWAYWANPIMPGEATGLLLDSIKMEKNPGEKCYYAINVVAQFATVGDWEYFDNWDPESDAAKVMAAAVSNVTTVTVTNNGSSTLKPNETTTFSATATKASNAGTATAAESAFEWAVYDENLKLSETSKITVDEAGIATLTVGATETSKSLIVAAKDKASGAVGVSAVAVDVSVITAADITLLGNDTVYLPMEAGESKSYKLAFEGSDTPASFVVSAAYAKDADSTALTSEDYSYDPATQTLTLTQKAEGVRIEFVAQDTDTPVYGLEVNVPVTPSEAGFMAEAYYNDTYLGVMALNDAQNVFYKVNLTEDGTPEGTPLALTDIQLSGEYRNGMTYDSETNLLFVPDPSAMTTFLKAKYGESDVYILAVSEQSSQRALYLTNHNNMTGSSMTLENGVYKGTYTPGHSYEIQADVIDPWTLVFETAEGYPLDDGLAIASMFFYAEEGAPADRGTSYLCIPEGYAEDIHLQGYYYDDSGTKHTASIVLTVEE